MYQCSILYHGCGELRVGNAPRVAYGVGHVKPRVVFVSISWSHAWLFRTTRGLARPRVAQLDHAWLNMSSP